MLARAGFRDDPLFAHAPRQQNLAQRVVDFVRAGVQQIFAFEIDAGAAAVFGQTLGQKERSGAAGIIA